ncbi:hypothetical protein AC578_3874 [Pseudocercospora eumusae]|uniref:Uncharacterized protein n=1 Tax=Pseudocercospora eumusae TaxID=321146 RepID=A0A139H1N1_9PEZI|nr:hypothetical protein AC578_3874 [Pseudocercospora eumusae]
MPELKARKTHFKRLPTPRTPSKPSISTHINRPLSLSLAAHTHTQTMPQPITPPPSNPPFDVLTCLETLIKSELQYWLSYLRHVRSPDNPTSWSEILDSSSAPSPKIPALRHILETLPLRYKALASAYRIPSDGLRLSDQLAALLESLRDEDAQGELEGWYEKTLVASKKVRKEVSGLEKEILELEDGRLEELKGCYKVLEDVKVFDGGREEVVGLIAAMDAVGLHCEEVGERE